MRFPKMRTCLPVLVIGYLLVLPGPADGQFLTPPPPPVEEDGGFGFGATTPASVVRWLTDAGVDWSEASPRTSAVLGPSYRNTFTTDDGAPLAVPLFGTAEANVFLHD
jgi:hypothetical protein